MLLRFSTSMWMNGVKRGDVSTMTIDQELRIAFLEESDIDEVIEMAQLEWVPGLN